MAASGIVKGIVTSVPEWSIREQLVLASAVQRSGDQNWVSVSRAIRPVMEEPKHQQDFSQKNCATQYAFMLDNASTPKRKRREDGGPEIVETVEEQIVRNLTEKRIKEIDQILSQTKEEYMTMKKEIEVIERGELDDRLHAMWQEMQPETTSLETSTKELSAQRSSPSKLAKFQIPSRQETEPSSTEPSSQQKEPKAEVKPEPPETPPPTTTQQTSCTGSVAPSNTVATSSASASSSPSSQHSSSSKEVHQEHPYSKQEVSKKDNIERPSEEEVKTAPPESTETISNQQQQQDEEIDLNANKNETPEPTDTNDKTEEKINTDVEEDTQPLEVIEEAPCLQSSNIEESQTKPSAATTEETPQVADKKEETAVEESHQIVQEESVKMEQDEEDVEVDVDVETRDDEVTNELEEKQQGNDSIEQQQENDSIEKQQGNDSIEKQQENEKQQGNDSIEKQQANDSIEKQQGNDSIDQKTAEEEKVTDEKDDKDDKVETKKAEEEEEIDVEEDDEEPSPVRARATRSSDGRKRRQPDVSRMLLDRIKTDKEDEREGSPSSITSPSPRVRRTTRASAKKRKTTRSSRLRAEEKDDSLIDSREVTDQDSEEELTSAFSSSVPSPAYSQGDGAQETHHAQRSWRKTIMLVWHHASQHKFATLFLHPVREEDAPGYYEIIHKPMDLSTIKRNIETGSIKTDMEFQHAMLLMFQNALMYNSSDHDVYRMAEEMKNDVMTQIDEYLKTQKMVSSSGTKALRSREARLRPEGASAEESFHKKMNTEESTPGKKRKPRAED